MATDEQRLHIQELEARIKVLEAENDLLAEKAEELLLLGSVAENISTLGQPNEVLINTLERICLIEGVPYSAFCEILDNDIFILSSYTCFREDLGFSDRIEFSAEAIANLGAGIQTFSSTQIENQEVMLQLEGLDFTPSTVICIPFSARLMQQGLLILADDSPQDGFSPDNEFLKRVLDVTVNRLDNLSLVQELQHLNMALNMEVDRRVGELSETNEELRKAMLQRLSVEESLLRQQDLVANISEASPVGIVIVDKNGEITYANTRAEKVLGLSKSQIAGRKYNDPKWKITDYHGNPFPENKLPFAQVQRTKQPVYNLRHAIEWTNGQRVLLLINAAPLFDDEFRIDGMVAMIDDVTEQFEAEAEFRRLQNFNASIVQNISEGIVIQDTNGYLTFVNPSAAKMLDLSPEELVDKHWKDIIAPDYHEIVVNADKRRRQGIADRYEVDLVTQNGRRFPVLVSGSPRIDIRSGEFQGTLAVFTDISEQKLAEKNRQALRDLAVKLSATTGIENVLQLCIEAAIDNTEMEAGGIYLVDSKTGDLHLKISQGLSPEFLKAAAFYPAESLNVQRAMEGEPIYLLYSDMNLPEDDFRLRENLVSIASLPIKFEGKIIALLNVASRSRETIPEFTKNMLGAIADQIGSAVARAQVEDQLKQRADQLALLNDVSEKIAAVLDLERVLELTAQLVHTSFGYQHIALFMINPEKKTVELRTAAGDFKELLPPDHALRLGQGLVGVAASKNKTIIANNVENEPHYVNLYPDIIFSRAELSVPIQISGEVVGVIDVQSLQVNAFEEIDILVMETLADQVAVAIHNANLHESIQMELSERKRIESALRESEEKFRNIVQSSPMGMHMYQLEPDGRLVFVDANLAADQILGVDNRQFIGKTIEEAFPALMDTEVPKKYRLAAKNGQSWKTQQLDYDENEIAGAFEVFAFQTSPGRMVALFLEITERKRAEEALKNSENTLSSIFRAAPTGIGLVSERKLLRVNQRVCEMTGYSQEELIGQNARILYPSDEDYEYVGQEKYRQIREFGTGTVETRWQHKDGEIIHILMSSTPIDPTNLLAGVTFTALDITERKQAEEALRRSENTLSSIFRVAPTGIGLMIKHIILQVNIRICEMTNYEREELVEQSIQMLFPTQKHYEYYLREVYGQIENHGSGTIETRWKTKHNQVIDVLLSATPVDSHDWSLGIIFTALDITDRKVAEARIQRQLRRLAALTQIDAAITGNLDLERTAKVILEQSVNQLTVDAAAILLFKSPTQTLEYFDGIGFYTDAIKKSNLRLGQNFAGRAALERRTIKATEESPGFRNYDPFAVEGFRCYYGVPLIAKGQIKGVLEVFNHDLIDPSPGWLSFLETIAGQAAIAIENAEMVDNLERSNMELRLAYNNTLEGWAKALELRDFETEGHSQRVTDLTIQIARAVGIPDDELVHVQRGALLHDIGKMGIPDHILLKDGPLDDDEWEIMRKHPLYAHDMLSTITFLRPALDIPLYHHEKWNGTGYPYGLAAEAIPLAARVFAIVDVWDALSSNRPYRPAWPQAKILALIHSESGKHFDPNVVTAFEQIIHQ